MDVLSDLNLLQETFLSSTFNFSRNNNQQVLGVKSYVFFRILRREPVVHLDFPLFYIPDKASWKLVFWPTFFPLGELE